MKGVPLFLFVFFMAFRTFMNAQPSSKHDIFVFTDDKSFKKDGKDVDYKKLKIKSYKHWDLYLHENQCYLGRTYVQLKDENEFEDFLDINEEVREEFFQIGQKVKKALKTLFKPDKMNYAALSNTSPVIHMHIIPRYKEAKVFDGITFKDARWGQNYAPYDRSFSIDESTLFKIRDALKEKITM